jgi:hypothetical protein
MRLGRMGMGPVRRGGITYVGDDGRWREYRHRRHSVGGWSLDPFTGVGIGVLWPRGARKPMMDPVVRGGTTYVGTDGQWHVYKPTPRSVGGWSVDPVTGEGRAVLWPKGKPKPSSTPVKVGGITYIGTDGQWHVYDRNNPVAMR